MNKDTALRLALKAMVVNNKAWKHLADSGDAGYWEAEEQGYYQLNEEAITAVEAALEAKNEPVGLIESLKDAQPCCGQYETCWRACTPRGKFIGQRDAQRTWVGLDEKDFSAINQSCLTKLQAATSAESILKEKNT